MLPAALHSVGDIAWFWRCAGRMPQGRAERRLFLLSYPDDLLARLHPHHLYRFVQPWLRSPDALRPMVLLH